MFALEELCSRAPPCLGRPSPQWVLLLLLVRLLRLANWVPCLGASFVHSGVSLSHLCVSPEDHVHFCAARVSFGACRRRDPGVLLVASVHPPTPFKGALGCIATWGLGFWLLEILAFGGWYLNTHPSIPLGEIT